MKLKYVTKKLNILFLIVATIMQINESRAIGVI